MIKLMLHGCNGKIGRAITRLVQDNDEVKIAVGIDPFTDVPNTYPVFPTIQACDIDVDVIVDFSTASAVRPLIDYAVSRNTPAVICTTGLSEEDIVYLKEASQKVPIFFSANMSLGVNLLISLAKRAAEILGTSGFDIEIIEKHHNQKIDAPSGTALAIADAINDTLDHAYHYKYDRSTVREKRKPNEIGIHAIRGGTIVGEHDILFAGNDEFVTLSHQATSKEVFATGAIRAALFLADQPTGLYNMDQLLDA